MLLFRREDTSHKMFSGERSDQQLSRYGSLAMFREVFFVNKFHRKPENLGAESCGCMIPVQREVLVKMFKICYNNVTGQPKRGM